MFGPIWETGTNNAHLVNAVQEAREAYLSIYTKKLRESLKAVIVFETIVQVPLVQADVQVMNEEKKNILSDEKVPVNDSFDI